MRFLNSNFQKKMFLQYTAVVGAVVFVFYLAFFWFTASIYENIFRTNLDTAAWRTSKELDSTFRDMDKMALYLLSNPDLRAALALCAAQDVENYQLENMSMSIMSSIMVPVDAGKYRASVFNAKGNFLSIGLQYDVGKAAAFLEADDFDAYYNRYALRSNSRFITSPHPDLVTNEGRSMVTLYREMSTPEKTVSLALISIECPFSIIEQLIVPHDSFTQAFLVDQNGVLLLGDADDFASVTKQTGQGLSALAAPWYSAKFTSEYAGWTLYLATPKTILLGILFPIALCSIALVLVIAFIMASQGYILAKKATKPLVELRHAIQAASFENPKVTVHSAEFGQEFSEVSLAFENMFARLADTMDEVVKVKALELEAHLKALQSQMNPHFFYNVIALIKATGREGDTDKMADICDNMTSILRYISSFRENIVPLNTEVSHSKSYMEIMKLRFEDQLEYTYTVDRGTKFDTTQVPKLIILPLLENCFQHAFTQMLPPWKVYVSVRFEGSRFYIAVEDNGKGISEETLARINTQLDEFLANPASKVFDLQVGGLGLINTLIRLRLMYKENYYFRVSSTKEGFNKIEIGGGSDA